MLLAAPALVMLVKLFSIELCSIKNWHKMYENIYYGILTASFYTYDYFITTKLELSILLTRIHSYIISNILQALLFASLFFHICILQC